MKKGWKTYASGALSILWGVGGIYFGVHGLDVGVGFVIAGLATIGLRHKLDDIGLPPNVVDKVMELQKNATGTSKPEAK